MRIIWPPPVLSSYWLAPAAGGIALILVGLLIYANPRLLAYFVAAVFILAGAGLLSLAWRMRARVSIHRLDGLPNDDDPPEPP